jgi:hypothetical protein
MYIIIVVACYLENSSGLQWPNTIDEIENEKKVTSKLYSFALMVFQLLQHGVHAYAMQGNTTHQCQHHLGLPSSTAAIRIYRRVS